MLPENLIRCTTLPTQGNATMHGAGPSPDTRYRCCSGSHGEPSSHSRFGGRPCSGWARRPAMPPRAAWMPIAADPGDDLDVREQAVFALSQRPANEGVPALIRIARTNPHPELRKKPSSGWVRARIRRRWPCSRNSCGKALPLHSPQAGVERPSCRPPMASRVRRRPVGGKAAHARRGPGGRPLAHVRELVIRRCSVTSRDGGRHLA